MWKDLEIAVLLAANCDFNRAVDVLGFRVVELPAMDLPRSLEEFSGGELGRGMLTGLAGIGPIYER